jgi:hypothetical protein
MTVHSLTIYGKLAMIISKAGWSSAMAYTTGTLRTFNAFSDIIGLLGEEMSLCLNSVSEVRLDRLVLTPPSKFTTSL